MDSAIYIYQRLKDDVKTWCNTHLFIAINFEFQRTQLQFDIYTLKHLPIVVHIARNNHYGKIYLFSL